MSNKSVWCVMRHWVRHEDDTCGTDLAFICGNPETANIVKDKLQKQYEGNEHWKKNNLIAYSVEDHELHNKPPVGRELISQ
jgi:hypothetical protein